MASIVDGHDIPPQRGNEIHEALADSKRVVVKKVPWNEEIVTYGAGCKQLLGIGAETFVCISRIDDETAKLGKDIHIEIYREERKSDDLPLATITRTGKRGDTRVELSNKASCHLDGTAIYLKNSGGDATFFVGDINDFKEVRRRYDKYNAPKTSTPDSSPDASPESSAEDDDKDDKNKGDEYKHQTPWYACCFGSSAPKNPGKITTQTKDFKIVRANDYKNQLDAVKRADSLEITVSDEANMNDDIVLNVCLMIAIDFSHNDQQLHTMANTN